LAGFGVFVLVVDALDPGPERLIEFGLLLSIENGLSRTLTLVANPLNTYAKLSLPPDHSTILGIRGHLAGPLRVVMLQIDGMSTTLGIRHQYHFA